LLHAPLLAALLEQSMDDFDDDALLALDVDAITARHRGVEQAAQEKLREHWGHTEFRDNQLEALRAVLNGQDCLVVMATGSGKSLCFQLAPLVAGKPAVVVSPLIALMQDQVLALKARGVRAVLLGSAQADRTAEARAMAGDYDLVYVTPELLAGGRLDLLRMQRTCGLSLLAVDEAHCVCEWGFDFRPDYAQIGARRPAGVPLMALTATAPPAVRHHLCANLRMAPDTLQLVGSPAGGKGRPHPGRGQRPVRPFCAS
jgi:ATP-dependent DNA helicase RecQ